jgi:hypothetical protein
MQRSSGVFSTSNEQKSKHQEARMRDRSTRYASEIEETCVRLTCSIEHEDHVFPERLARTQSSHQHRQDPIRSLRLACVDDDVALAVLGLVMMRMERVILVLGRCG